MNHMENNTKNDYFPGPTLNSISCVSIHGSVRVYYLKNLVYLGIGPYFK